MEKTLPSYDPTPAHFDADIEIVLDPLHLPPSAFAALFLLNNEGAIGDGFSIYRMKFEFVPDQFILDDPESGCRFWFDPREGGRWVDGIYNPEKLKAASIMTLYYDVAGCPVNFCFEDADNGVLTEKEFYFFYNKSENTHQFIKRLLT